MSVIEDIVLAPAERYIHLSSEFANENRGNPSECHFRVNSAISAGNEEYCMLLGVHNATIPHTWYNIFGTRWAIHFGYGGVDVLTGSIVDQNYTAATLAAVFQASVQAAQVAAGLSATFVVTYNSATNFYTFSNSVVAGAAPWYFVYIEDNIYLELGLRLLSQGKTNAVASSFTGVDYSLTPMAMVDLSGFHGVYVQLQGYTSNSLASYNGLNQAAILARVPIRNPFGAIETYEPDNVEYVVLPNAALTDLHIILVGDDGEQLNLHGIDWTMTLHVKFAAIRRPAASTERLLPADSIQTTQLFGGRRVY
jgi:hypothetical protein